MKCPKCGKKLDRILVSAKTTNGKAGVLISHAYSINQAFSGKAMCDYTTLGEIKGINLDTG